MQGNTASDQSPIAVIGGGVTGLTAAFRLRELAPDRKVVLFESSPRLGGVLQTRRRDDYTLELGPDSLLSRLPWGVGLCHRLGIEDELTGTAPAARGVYTVHHGRVVRMPEGLAIMAPGRVRPILATPLLSWRGKLRMGAERLIPPRKDPSDESLAAFARRRLGQEAYERFVQPLAGGIFMGDPERLSLRACFPQFAAMEAEHGSLIRAMRRAKNEQPGDSKQKPRSMFVAPRKGLGRLIEALAEKIPDDALRLNQQARQLWREENVWRMEIEDLAIGERHVDSFAGVILATPAGATANLLENLDQPVSEILRSMDYSGCAIVQLAYRVDQVRHALDASGVVVPAVENRPMQACSFTSVKYAGRAPEGAVLFRAFFGGAQRPETLDQKDDQLIDLAKREVAKLLGVKGSPELVEVTRWRRSMPQYHLGHLERMDALDARIALHPGLEVAGAAYRGVGIPHCIHSSEQAVDRLLASFSLNDTVPEEATP